jgi:hypothetical protein
MKRTFKIGLAVFAILVLLAGMSKAALDEITNFSGVHVSGSFATATPVFLANQQGLGRIAEFQDAGTAIAYIDDGGAATFANDVSVGGDLSVTGSTTLTDECLWGAADTDAVKVLGFLSTRNAGDTSYWQQIMDASERPRPSDGATLAYRLGDVVGLSYFDALFVNALFTTTTTIPVRGIEAKVTNGSDGTHTGSELSALYAKIATSSGNTTPLAYGVNSSLDTDGTLTSGTNFYAQHEGSGTVTASSVLATSADTWTSGVNLDAGTFTTDIVLQNSETIDNASNGVLNLTSPSVKVTGSGIVDGAADAVQLTVQGNSSQTAQDFVVESSNGDDKFTVSNAGNVVTVGTLQYGANSLYPVGYASSGQAIVAAKSATFTGTVVIASGLTTVLSAICVPYTDPAAASATCSADWSGANVTLHSWKADGVTAGDIGTSVNYMIFGTK